MLRDDRSSYGHRRGPDSPLRDPARAPRGSQAQLTGWINHRHANTIDSFDQLPPIIVLQRINPALELALSK
ncbi:hypothetical protein PGT21_001363 [Puccinia graminis f. sp. tritici]|uniref:Uncharacterized protein n=1 Tax=Puccinia graminis f. sp. tritici TaxID=56615 RepID=A0A5B0MLV8_PUCGR|nr:hypothetical protein PGT21_001363 [Puccinia graminis f. sp. tritici]